MNALHLLENNICMHKIIEREAFCWEAYWLKRIGGNVKASKKYEEMVQVGENTPLGAIFIFHRFSIQLPRYWTIYSTLLVVYSIQPSFIWSRKMKYIRFHYKRSFLIIIQKIRQYTILYINYYIRYFIYSIYSIDILYTYFIFYILTVYTDLLCENR